MNSKGNRRTYRSGLEKSNISYWMIRLMHDNPVLPLVRNPYKLLNAAGLKQGQKVIEVGCGPGFFTIPSAERVGDEGHVYAVDTHPRAIERVSEKIAKGGLKNITPICTNASTTGLPDEIVDLAFLFGLRYVAGGLENVISELYRILKPDGSLAFEKTSGSEVKLIEKVEQKRFVYSGKQGRILLFKKKGV